MPHAPTELKLAEVTRPKDAGFSDRPQGLGG